EDRRTLPRRPSRRRMVLPYAPDGLRRGRSQGRAELTPREAVCYLPPLAAGERRRRTQARSSAWLERYVDIVEVSGSSPLGPTNTREPSFLRRQSPRSRDQGENRRLA